MRQVRSESKLKVLFVVGTLDIGGTERQLVKLAGGLDRTRFEPTVCCLSAPGPLAESLRSAGVRVESFNFRGIRRVRPVARALPVAVGTLVRLYRWMRAEAPHVVHGMLFHAYVIGTLTARAARVPVVVASRRSLSNFKAGKPHYWVAERIVNRLTDLVIANSEAVRQDVVAHEGLRPEEVTVIFNGLDIEEFSIVPRGELRRELEISESWPVVAVVANFIHYKGHRYFLEAWATIRERYPRAVALLIGDGPLRKSMEEEATTRGLNGSVRFLGTRHDVPELLALSDLLVHPSLEEGFSNALIEAMAAGRPVVATRVGGNPEAVEDGVTGLLVPARDSAGLAEAVLWLLERPDDMRRFGEEGQRRAEERFSVGRVIQQYEQIYRRLAASRGL
jgi:L-malate glycosyltransferase